MICEEKQQYHIKVWYVDTVWETGASSANFGSWRDSYIWRFIICMPFYQVSGCN